jgi:hypothetical protein
MPHWLSNLDYQFQIPRSLSHLVFKVRHHRNKVAMYFDMANYRHYTCIIATTATEKYNVRLQGTTQSNSVTKYNF